MKKSITLKIIAVTAAALLLFFAAMILVFDNINKRSAENNVSAVLKIYEKQIAGKNISIDDYREIAKQPDSAKSVRITFINVDGTVIADTLSDDIDENHADRKEVKAALNGKTGKDIRMSATFKIKYIYIAKLVATSNGNIVLRTAIPIRSVNAYLVSAVVAMVVIMIAVLIAAVLTTARIAKNLVKPIELIRNKLVTVGIEGKDSPIELTKYDELNAVLSDIEELSSRLDSSILGYQSEKEKLGLILDNINQVIIAIDKDKNIVTANDLAGELFECECAAGMNIYKVIRNQEFLENINTAVTEKRLIDFDIRDKRGETYEIKIFPINSEEMRAIIVATQVTQVRKLQAEKQEFFQNASHELNTPLSSILGYSEMLTKGGKSNPEFAATIHKEAERMKNLISDMLKIAELEENREIPDEKIDFKNLVENVITSNIPNANDKKINIWREIEACNIIANTEKITEVVNNLLDNAIKYSGEKSDILITLKKSKDKVIFTVKDNGIGIPIIHQKRIFERFFRVDKGRSKKEGGTGLGLAIVKHICNHYNAPISLKSREGKGTEISITFQSAS